QKARALIDRHFVETLPRETLEPLLAHLRGCGECRAYYDRLFGFEAQVDGGKAEAERIGAQLFSTLEQPVKKSFFSFRRLAPAFTAVAVAGVAGIIVVNGNHEPGMGPESIIVVNGATGELAERGGPPAALDSQVELQAVCFADHGHGPESPVELGAERPFQACPRGGRIALAYRRAQEGDRLVVFSARGRDVTQLLPAAGEAPTLLQPDEGTRPIPGSFVIAQDAEPGEVALVAFVGKSLDPAKLKEALEQGAALQDAQALRVQRLTYRLDPK
ncbi:MAG: hypothetical protein ACK4N5_26525, partial [Myxococcales bacterium]